MEPPNSQKDVTSYMAALSHFISRLGIRGLPFFKLLRKLDNFVWTVEAQLALDELKTYLSNPLILIPSNLEEKLQLYISATTHVVRTILVVDRAEEGHIQKVYHPVYFISEVFNDSKLCYFHIQKWLYALLITFRKLK